MTLSLALFLRVILIGVPTSNRRPTSPIYFDSFSTALPSILKPKQYPACVLKLPKKPQTIYTNDSLYPTFVVYFLDYTRPNIFTSFITYSWTDNLIFKELFGLFRFCFTKLRHLF